MEAKLPPLNSVRAFEVAARHLNFSRAAEEVGVTPSAISKQILLLEDFIGAKLFERLPGGLSLTVEGVALKQSVTPAFEMMGHAFQRFSRRAPRSNVCRLATVPSFAGQFLIPRLDAFKESFPDVELEILTSYRLVDFEREEVDIGIRHGQGGWDDVVSTPLVKGQQLAVCAPELLGARGDKTLSEFVQSSRRIQAFSNDEWRVWADHVGIEFNPVNTPFIIEDYLVAVAAATAGQGIALLPEILCCQLLREGKLVTFCETRLPWPISYHLIHSPNAERRPIVRDVIAWLRGEVAKAGLAAEENKSS